MLKNNKVNNIEHIITNSEIESYIRKLENDIKYYIKIYFHCKIKNNLLVQKLNEYMDMQEEFEQLKTKVKYDEGKFLENDRKDNEIMILKKENSNLKNEIINLEHKNKQYEKNLQKNQLIISTLKNEIKQLNLKLYETTNNNNGNENSNSSRNISIRILNRRHLIKNNMTSETLQKNKKITLNSSASSIFIPKPENHNNILIRCLKIKKDNSDKFEKNQSNSVVIRDNHENKSENKEFYSKNVESNNDRKNSRRFYRLGGSWSNKDKKNYSKRESTKPFYQFSVNIYGNN